MRSSVARISSRFLFAPLTRLAGRRVVRYRGEVENYSSAYIHIYIYTPDARILITRAGPVVPFNEGRAFNTWTTGGGQWRERARFWLVLEPALSSSSFPFVPSRPVPTHPPKTRLSRWLNFIFRPHPLRMCARKSFLLLLLFLHLPVPLEFLFCFAESICQAFITGRGDWVQ